MKRKILVVDDEQGITRMIKLNLERTGDYEVRTENSGKLARQVAIEFRPDLIFLDIMMPDLSGDQVSGLLKEEPELKETKVVFLTAIVTRDETANGHNRIGGQIFLAKPVNTKDLIYTINQVLGT